MIPVARGRTEVAATQPHSHIPHQRKHEPVAGCGEARTGPETPSVRAGATVLPATATALESGGQARLWLLGIGAAVLWSAWYVIACAIHPFTNCGKCEGSGKKRDNGGRGKNWRNCRRCKGSGKRLRFGRHVYNYLRKLEKDSV